jgi:hypothetical protein
MTQQLEPLSIATLQYLTHKNFIRYTFIRMEPEKLT